MLDSPIEFLKGVGPTKARLLREELGIHTFEDLLLHFPFRYVDKTKFHIINEVTEEGAAYQVKGILRNLQTVGEGRKKRMTAILRDETGSLDLVWFTGIQWLEKILVVGQEYIVYGKPTFFNGRPQLVHPEMDIITESTAQKASTLQPVYPTTEKLKAKNMDSKGLMQIMKALFTALHPNRQEVKESMPQYLLEKFHFQGRYEALLNIHFPKNDEVLEGARKRLKFEELFLMQLRILKGKSNRVQGLHGHIFASIGEYFNRFYNEKLPFQLTNAQKRVLKEIRKDMGSGRQMNRLLQGDVGSGKTVVALMTMLMALDNGFQAAMMAPTEILAQQHFQALEELLKGMDVRIAILTGSTKAKQRREIHQALESGELHILVGTHALIEPVVKFHNLGVVVVDEQHRFGVAQRARLWEKGKQGPPHVLVMTATPIPRTLAMTLYGDLDVSVIDELPPGRTPIKTEHKYESHRLRVFGFLREQIAMGHQAYVVYPMIEESETMDEIKNLMEGYEAISREFPAPEYQLSIVHGQMKPADKEYEMQRFVRNETQIMVATTVIEVGVNVPNASIMVIENADRFGLSQLHQLRGRVGRGAAVSYCLLLTDFKLSAVARERIKTMCATTNGFDIAETDLRLRGPGNLEGTQQSGVLNFRIADLAKDGAILHTARHIAIEILEADPVLSKPEHLGLRQYMEKTQKKDGWGRIS